MAFRRNKFRLPDKLVLFLGWYRFVQLIAFFGAIGVLGLDLGVRGSEVIERWAFPWIEGGLCIIFAFRAIQIYRYSSGFQTAFGRCQSESILIVIAVLGMLLTPLSEEPMMAIHDGLRFVLLGFVLVTVFNTLRSIQRLAVSPLQVFVWTYVLLIFVGALLLMLPRSHAEGLQIPFVDALFMSASACCVTGLSLFDVGRDFTGFGQVILMVLFQIGGLGIMTFAAFAAIASGAGMSLRDRVAMGEVLNTDTVGKVSRLILWILGITIVCEALGAYLLYGSWLDAAGNPLPAKEQLFSSIFHSVSAFCNAGFSLNSSSLTEQADNTLVMLTMSGLVVIGGIGFMVLLDLMRYKPHHSLAARRMPFLPAVLRAKLKKHPIPRLQLQTKIVLTMTCGLIVFGTVAFWLLEVDNTLAGKSASEQALGAFFQGGVTPRTAGFNSLDYSQMKPATWYLTILLMIIGASPGSTGGGLKTTSFAILFLTLMNTLRNRPVEVFKRRIAQEQIGRVLVVLMVGLLLVNTAVFAICVTDPQVLDLPQGFLKLTFEVVSAFGTVGLSTGINNEFSDPGKIVLCLCMFFGRIGPLTLVLSLGRKASAAFDYPTENVMLG